MYLKCWTRGVGFPVHPCVSGEQFPSEGRRITDSKMSCMWFVCVGVCGVGCVQRIDHMVGWGEGGVEFLSGLKWPPYSPSALQSAEP